MSDIEQAEIDALNSVQKKLYNQSAEMGWHDVPYIEFEMAVTNSYVEKLEKHILKQDKLIKKYSFATKLMLIVSEIAEAMEGHRKNLMDDHLKTRKMYEVELADAVIRIFDLAGKEGLDLAGAIAEKHKYNRTRADHQKEARNSQNGKSY